MRYLRMAVVLIFALAPRVAGAHTGDKCQAAKMKAAGALTLAKAKCQAKALKKGVAVDPVCLTKADDTFAAAISKADPQGSCAGTATALQAPVDMSLADALTSLAIATQPVVNTCQAGKITAIGNDAHADAVCWATALKKGVAVDAKCLTNAGAKFATAMSKADAHGTCSGTPAALQTVVDSAVTGIQAALHCASGQHTCSGECVDLATDPQHCGTCGTACPIGAPVCSDGSCTCPANYTTCGRFGACVDTSSDRYYCGSCFALICPNNAACVDGVCTCPAPRSLCLFQCIDLQSDNNNCGTCGNVCPSGTVCRGGTCGCPSSDPDIVFCNGACVNIKTDGNNCGACGQYCREFTSCDNGTCRAPCQQPSDCPDGAFCSDEIQNPLFDYHWCYNLGGDGAACYHNSECSNSSFASCCCVPTSPAGQGGTCSIYNDCPSSITQCDACIPAGHRASSYCDLSLGSDYQCCSQKCFVKFGTGGFGTCCNPAGYPAPSCSATGTDYDCCSNQCDFSTNTCR